MNFNIIIYISFFILCIFVFILYKNNETYKTYNTKNTIPRFKLYNIQNKLLNNTDWEYSEQQLLFKYIKPTDHVLQLGGNIGASCIMVDKLINNNNLNICVEPNKQILNTLKRNKQFNNCRFKIIPGIFSEKKNKKMNIPDSAPVWRGVVQNYAGQRIFDKGNMSIKSYPLKKLKNYKKINVLFADCEGCLDKFLNEYPFILNQLRLIIYEEDYKNECDYKKIEKHLKLLNFKKVYREFDQVFRTVWLKY